MENTFLYGRKKNACLQQQQQQKLSGKTDMKNHIFALVLKTAVDSFLCFFSKQFMYKI